MKYEHLYRCHYDLTPGKRKLALRHGATEVQTLKFWRELQDAGKMHWLASEHKERQASTDCGPLFGN